MMAPRDRDCLRIAVDVGGVKAEVVALDVLARLQLIARRCGYRIVLERASPELVELIELAGLSQVLEVNPVRSDSTAPRY